MLLGPSFYFPGPGRGAFFLFLFLPVSCPCLVVMDAVVSLRSSLKLQIQRCPRHSGLIGQRPEWQRLQLVGRRGGGKRGGQCHLPGAPIVSRRVQYLSLKDAVESTINAYLILNFYSRCSQTQLCLTLKITVI